MKGRLLCGPSDSCLLQQCHGAGSAIGLQKEEGTDMHGHVREPYKAIQGLSSCHGNATDARVPNALPRVSPPEGKMTRAAMNDRGGCRAKFETA